ncbi:MAG TPA: MBL fold metallo-hydrolase [Vicinamibacterales bacterium]|jgi:glyoxylase-like metal-dependent hydrolase (beta-lactamase superfamily II)
MNRVRCALVLAGIATSAIVFHAQTPAAKAAYKFTEIVPGIYSAIGTGTMNVGSNSAVIVNQDDVVIVDSHISPESGRAMLQELKAITDKPVRVLIDTHFHYDHTNGNQAFPPGVEIIGHEFTRRKMTGDVLEKGMLADLIKATPKQLDDLKARAAAETDPSAKARLAQQVGVQTSFGASLRDLKVTPPNVTINDRLTLFRGDREIRLLYLGRGHTGGDLVVYLPKERLLCSGDLLVNGVANLIDGFVDEWPDTLEKLKPLDFVDVIPGHGDPFRGKERIDWFQAYLRDFWKQGTILHGEKVPAADAARRIDMTAHRAHFPAITTPGVNPAWVARMFEVMEHRAEP